MSPIFFFLSILVLSSTSSSAEPVLDIDGNPVLAGTTAYNIIPLIRGSGGGLTMKSRTEMCPLYVGQENQEVDFGLPLRFLPANSTGAATVEQSADVNVQFLDVFTICLNSNVWQLDGSYIRTDGVLGNPGASTLSNWFRFDKLLTSPNTYAIVFCPSVCDYCKPFCGKIGVFLEDESRWLGIGGSSFPVRFKKVTGLAAPHMSH